MKTHLAATTRAFLCAALLPSVTPLIHAQGMQDSSAFASQELKTESPKTSPDRLKDLKQREEKAFSQLAAMLNRLPGEPELLGTNKLFKYIDQSDRDMKQIRTGCASLLRTLRTEVATIENSTYFSDDQKQELSDSAEALATDCAELSSKLDLAVQRLAAAYTVLPRLNKIHKAYHNLQSRDKAAGQVKVKVQDYLKSFSPEPESQTEHDSGQESSSSVNAEANSIGK